MNKTILWSEGDITPRICRRCHSQIRGPMRRVSENGYIEYECADPCREADWLDDSSAGEARVQDHFEEHADTELAAMRRNSDE